MKRNARLSALMLTLLLVVTATFLPVVTYAAETTNESERHYLGAVVNAGHDTGFSESNTITEKDPHFGWTIGSFYVDGFTAKAEENSESPVFLKNTGDKITLWFELKQDIDKLNGNDELSICSDENGYDQYFGINKTNMGRGTLIIRHTNHQNHAGEPVIYTDYLAANATKGAAVAVNLCEEGDYEVALNYEIRKENLDIFGWNPFPSYYNYRIFFRFSVRNGNSMVFPRDVTTGAELTNSSITENGFYLDFAKSRYLNINIKREVRKEGAEGLTEDVRFNKPAADGEQYTDEGIYTITASNKYTGLTTTKVIYVGTNEVLKAHTVTGLSIAEVEYQLSLGATVAKDGTLIPAPEPMSPLTEEPKTQKLQAWPFVVGGVIVVIVGVVAVVVFKQRKKANPAVRGKAELETNDNRGVDV